jgi:hypothetical protein
MGSRDGLSTIVFARSGYCSKSFLAVIPFMILTMVAGANFGWAVIKR